MPIAWCYRSPTETQRSARGGHPGAPTFPDGRVGHDKSCKIDPPATEWSSGSGSNRFPMQIRPYKRSVRYRCLSDFVTDKCRTNVTDMPSLTSEPSPTRLLRSLIGQFFTLILMVASGFAQTYGKVPNLASAPPASVTQVQLDRTFFGTHGTPRQQGLPRERGCRAALARQRRRGGWSSTCPSCPP